MNVAIIDAYHDSDRGGAGILAGLLNILYTIENELKIDMRIGIVYRFSKDDKRFNGVDRHTKKSFPRVIVHGSPIKTFFSNKGFRMKISLAFSLVYSFLKLCFPSMSSDPTIKVLQDSDLVISKGGHFYQFHSKNSLKGLIYAYQSFYNLLLSIRLRKKISLIAHSVGPFNNNTSKTIARFVFKRVDFLSTRETISKKILVELGIKEDKVQVLPDSAFALIPVLDKNLECLLTKYKLKKKEYATITARYWNFPGCDPYRVSQAYDKYLSALAEIGDYLTKRKYVDKVVLVVHNDGKHNELEDDLKPINAVLERINQQDRVVLIDEDLSPSMQSGLYGGARLMIGTRLHSVIFSLVGGAPAIAISYTHKVDGIMKMLGLENYVLNIKSMEISKAVDMIQNLIAEEAHLMGKVKSKIQKFQLELKAALEQIILSNLSDLDYSRAKGRANTNLDD